MTADAPTGDVSPGPATRGIGPGGSPPLDQAFDAGSLHLLRGAVAAHASAAGMSPSRVDDVVLAAHEMTANAVRHGTGRRWLRLYSDGRALCCRVSDDGPAARDRKPGPGPGAVPAWPVEHGHGLWIIGQVADQFSIDHGPAGTTATASFTVSPPMGAGDEAT
jgi:anti-sigma regulatory factor (Ser/Thr protein kinase)